MSNLTQQASAQADRGTRHVGIISPVGLIAAVAALVGASCCALPLALAWLGLTGAWIANLEIFVVHRPYFTAFAILVIGLGWVMALRGHASQRAFVILGVATVLIAAALLIAHYDTELTRYLMSLRRKG